MLIVKRPSAGRRFFGGSLSQPKCSCLILGDGPSPTRTSPGSFIPTTADNLLTNLSRRSFGKGG